MKWNWTEPNHLSLKKSAKRRASICCTVVCLEASCEETNTSVCLLNIWIWRYAFSWQIFLEITNHQTCYWWSCDCYACRMPPVCTWADIFHWCWRVDIIKTLLVYNINISGVSLYNVCFKQNHTEWIITYAFHTYLPASCTNCWNKKQALLSSSNDYEGPDFSESGLVAYFKQCLGTFMKG